MDWSRQFHQRQGGHTGALQDRNARPESAGARPGGVQKNWCEISVKKCGFHGSWWDFNEI